MSKGDKDPFRFTFRHFIRLSLFLLILFFLISSLSSSTPSSASISDPTILGTNTGSLSPSPDLSPYIKKLNDYIPNSVKDSYNKISSSPAIINLQQQTSGLTQNLNDFPQKQIKEIKLSIINSIYQAVVKEVENQ